MSQDIAIELASVDLHGWDLVFIDNGSTSAQREAVIRQVAPRLPAGTIMVVHDIEVEAYRQAAAPLRCDYITKGISPFTGLFTANGLDDSVRKALRKWNQTLQREAPTTAPNNVDRWVELARREMPATFPGMST
jgi:hypothetical protein